MSRTSDTSDRVMVASTISLPIDEAMTLVGDELDGQIKVRKELMSHMVGTLYPSILRGEIERLVTRKVRTDRWHGLYP